MKTHLLPGPMIGPVEREGKPATCGVVFAGGVYLAWCYAGCEQCSAPTCEECRALEAACSHEWLDAVNPYNPLDGRHGSVCNLCGSYVRDES
jgi:hypothetical protein